MAKKTTEEVIIPEPVEVEVREGVQSFFINSVGKRVECQPVGHDLITNLIKTIEKRYRDRGEPLDPPTYEFEAEGGITMVAPHDETTVSTLEEKAAWDAHVDALSRLAQEQNEGTLRTLCLRGVRFNPEGEEYRQWLEEEAFIGALPEGDLERRYRFIRSNLIVTVHDLPDSDKLKLTETAILLGFKGATKEQIAQMREMFRRQVGDAGRGNDTPNGTGNGGEE